MTAHSSRSTRTGSGRDRARRPEQKRRVAITDKELRGLVAASDLKSKDRTTLLALADGLNRQTLLISMGGDRLAEMLGLKRRQAIRRLRSLESTGVIVPIRQGGGRAEDGRGYVNTWKLDLERLRGTPKGVTEGTDCDVSEQTEGRPSRDPRVSQDAPDSTLQDPQEKNPSGGSPLAGGASDPPRDPGRRRPYVNRHASPGVQRVQVIHQLTALRDDLRAKSDRLRSAGAAGHREADAGGE
jgi:predicted transcriptional regulator